MQSLCFLVLLLSQSVVDLAASQHDSDCSCHSDDYFDRPSHTDQEKTARWMLSTIRWGILSTISSRLVMDRESGKVIPTSAMSGSDAVKIRDNEKQPVPFGNVFSFADAPCGNSSPDIYLYGTYMDASFKDLEKNAAVSLAISEASIDSTCVPDNSISQLCSEEMNPPCARLVVSGTIQVLQEPAEITSAKKALFSKHPAMEEWPEEHEFVAAKLTVQDLWLIDFFGGGSTLDLDRFRSIILHDDKRKVPSSYAERALVG